MNHPGAIIDKAEEQSCKCTKDGCGCATNRMTDYKRREYRRKLLEDLKNNLTLHGYRQLATERGWRRTSWILVMTILTSFAVYLFYNMLLDFGHKTVLEYEIQDGGINLNYPTITICGNSPVHGDKSHSRFPINITLDEFKLFYVELLSTLSYTYNISTRTSEILKELQTLNITTYKGILHLFEHTIHDTTESDEWKLIMNGPTCFFGNKPCNLSKDFKGTLQWKYSLCHQWNYYGTEKTPKKQTAADETLTMLLNVHTQLKLISYYPFYGVVLYIHPYGTPHHLTQYTDSIGLQTGMFTTVDIELTEVKLCFL